MNARESRLHAIISGSVQGVGYRQFALRHALQLSLTGWVRNRWDRKVELVAEGSPSDLQSLLDTLSNGPPASAVRHIDVSWQPATGEYAAFTIIS